MSIKGIYNSIIGLLFLALGIAALVVALDNKDVVCGHGGSPPLRDWLFGTGIAGIITGACLSIIGVLLIFTGVGAIVVILVSWFAPGFWFAWMIVGSVALWRDGEDCEELNYAVWRCSEIIVIFLIVDFALRVVMNCVTKDEDDEQR